MSFGVILQQLGSGFLKTVLIFSVTLVLSLPLGWVVYFGRSSRNKIVSGLVIGFISIMSGTPLMLQLLLWYFGPFYLFRMNIGNYKFTALIIGFSLNYSAYFAEIYRSGVEAIDVGQYEAAQILGYSKLRTFVRIIFPQVMRIVMPAIGNEVITLVKDTSLAYSISYIEMFALAKQIAAKETTIIPFIVAGVFYYVFNYAVAKGITLTERKLAFY
ncbi:MAG: amino acid ABC transporter permease [Lachnospiraceae bacterium]|nr:amino acid ABC transporter permease [Lachnospiraceae bacterium]